MRTIYLDVLLVFELYMSFLLLRLTARLTHTRLSFFRTFLGAALGSLSSLLVLLPPMPFVLSLLCKLISSLLMCLAAFGIRDKRLLVWHVVCFLGVSCVLAGMLLALTATGNVIYTNGGWYPVISLRLLVIFTILAYGILTVISRIRQRHAAADGSFEVIIRRGAHTARLDGLADTGNSLTDFCTGKPVIIVSHSLLGEMIPPLPCRGFRPLPYTTVAGEGVLTVFHPDEVILCSRRTDRRKSVDVLIGIDEESHPQAIFHPNLFS